MPRIVLTGFRGSGKTTVGTMISDRLGIPFYDTDAMVEAATEKSIDEIFSSEGEAAFREAEAAAIRALPASPCIVATGGGAVMNPGNVMRLRKGSLVFLLRVKAGTAAARINGSDRPSLTDLPAELEAAEIIASRMPVYMSSSDFCIDAEESPVKICDRIIWLAGCGDGPCDNDDPSTAAEFFRNAPMSEDNRERTLRRLGKSGTVPFCAIAGDPCLHSKSPFVYSRLFEIYGIDSHYTYMQAGDIGTIIDVMRKACMKGISVTIPFKEEVMEYLDETDIHSERIGAVNTVLNSCGILRGTNTDWIGVREPLKDTAGKRAAVFGAGGAAKAAVYALRNLGKDVTVVNRTAAKGIDLAERFGCEFSSPADFNPDDADIVVNATSLGMGGKGSPLTAAMISPDMTVFDLVYTPKVTPLLAMAEEAGCRCIPGTEMFVCQAIEQFRQFFGFSPDEAAVREAPGL